MLGIDKGVLVLDVPENSKAKAAGLKGTSRNKKGGVDIGDIIIGKFLVPILPGSLIIFFHMQELRIARLPLRLICLQPSRDIKLETSSLSQFFGRIQVEQTFVYCLLLSFFFVFPPLLYFFL
jgi:hypothetical protein